MKENEVSHEIGRHSEQLRLLADALLRYSSSDEISNKRANILARFLAFLSEWANDYDTALGGRGYEIDALIRDALKNSRRDFNDDIISDYVVLFGRILWRKYLHTGSRSGPESALLQWLSVHNPHLSPTEREFVELTVPFFIAEHSRLVARTAEARVAVEAKRIEELTTGHTSLIKGWKDEFDAFDKRLEENRAFAGKLVEDFNFVGLSGAFSDMERSKRRELVWTKLYLHLMGAAVLALPAYLIFHSRTPEMLDQILRGTTTFEVGRFLGALLFALPFVTIEILIIYFFRILLGNYASIRGQILQLQLRKSLCAFIQSYSEFSESLKGPKLEKFEALIFSGLTPDPQNIPSTFDGADQIAKIIQSIKDVAK